MKPEEITIQQMAKAIKLLKKEYFDYRNELETIFAKQSEMVTLREMAKKYNCYWKTLHKIINEEQVSLASLKKICVKILEKQND